MRKVTAIAVLSAAALSAALAGASSAQSTYSVFACPSDPKTQPIGKIYGANRGSTFCSDGASARVSVGSTKAIIIYLRNGVCWTSRQGFNVGIGTSIVGKRRQSDPEGLWLQDFKPGGFVKDSLGFGKGKVDWNGPVRINRAKRTFSGRAPKLVNGKLTYVSVSGSYTCRKVLDAPEQ